MLEAPSSCFARVLVSCGTRVEFIHSFIDTNTKFDQPNNQHQSSWRTYLLLHRNSHARLHIQGAVPYMHT